MPTTCLTLNPLGNNVFPAWCNSWVTANGKVHVPVDYDWKTVDKSEGSDPDESIQQGADLLNTMIGTHIANGPVYVFGHSKGGQVIGRWLIKYGNTSGYDPEELTFMTTGNPTSSLGHPPWIKFPMPKSTTPGFPIIDIGREGDGWCRWPDTNNLFVRIKSIIGMFTVHTDYKTKSLNASGIPTVYEETSTDGDTTYYTLS